MTKKTTAVAKRKENAVPDLAGLASGLRQTRRKLPTGGKPYLKFGKDGFWSLGRDGDSFADERAILNPTTLKSGFVCWTDYDKETLKRKKKNDKLGDEMELVSRGGVSYDDLPDVGEWEWKVQMSIEGRMLDGDQKDFVYTSSSTGGLDLFGEIIDAIDARLEDGEDVYIFPVVELQGDWYIHSTWGKIFKPQIEIVGWADVEGLIEGAEGEEQDDEPAPKKPKKPKRKKPEPEPEPEDEPEDEDEDKDEPEEEPEDEPEDEEPPRRRRRR